MKAIGVATLVMGALLGAGCYMPPIIGNSRSDGAADLSGSGGGLGSGGAGTGGSAGTGGMGGTGGTVAMTADAGDTGPGDTGPTDTGAGGSGGSAPGAFGCPPDEALVACYTFDSDPGTSVVDGSGLANNGTTNAVRSAGIQGNAVRFNDGNQIVQIRDAPSLKLVGSNATLEAWVRPSMHPPDETLHIIAGKQGLAGGYALGLAFGGKVEVVAGNKGYTAGSIPLDEWSHVAAVLSPDGVSLYHNGTRIGSFGRLDIVANDESLILGNRSRVAPPPPAPPLPSPPFFAFFGEIDVVRLYARARSAEEICADAGRRMVGPSCI